MMTLDGNYYINKAREGRITIAEPLGRAKKFSLEFAASAEA